MKFSYLVVAFFIVCAWFSCSEDHAIKDSTADIKVLVDTIITFDPETYEESIQVITYTVSADGKDTLEQTVKNLEPVPVQETIQLVKDETTGAVDTIVTFAVPE
ncbi:MAG: hypothetical protein AAFO82_03905 [Bacteroidota bacterium]